MGSDGDLGGGGGAWRDARQVRDADAAGDQLTSMLAAPTQLAVQDLVRSAEDCAIHRCSR